MPQQPVVSSVAAFMVLLALLPPTRAETIRGTTVTASGQPLAGVMVSCFDEEHRRWTSVFSQSDGTYVIDGLRDTDHMVRARLMGWRDEYPGDTAAGESDLVIDLQVAAGEELEDQQPANSAFGMLKFENARHTQNFKMMFRYCHQIRTIGFRTLEKPVDRETMLRRMDGFGGLYRHTQRTIIPRLISTYKGDAIRQWPTFVPPPAPTGTTAMARITAWEINKRAEGSFHDMEPGPDGLAYGLHSIELDNDGNMWFTLCATGQMANFDLQTKAFTICSSAEAPAQRGSCPHTLQINPEDPEGLIWYTDAGRNSCFSLHPETLKVRECHLLKAHQAVAAGKGESRGITPSGLDDSPVDGMIWYSRLNGNRIGRIAPNAPDGDIKEWNPRFRGPRRLHVAPQGMVWVLGFGSGVFENFNPETEEWTIYELPDAETQIPYALNVDSNGYVWICGTHNDTLNRFAPQTEEFIEFTLPTRVSYTRESEFDSDGNVWTSGPARHTEREYGQIIKLELPPGKHGDGIQLVSGRCSKEEFAQQADTGKSRIDASPAIAGSQLFLRDNRSLDGIEDTAGTVQKTAQTAPFARNVLLSLTNTPVPWWQTARKIADHRPSVPDTGTGTRKEFPGSGFTPCLTMSSPLLHLYLRGV